MTAPVEDMIRRTGLRAHHVPIETAAQRLTDQPAATGVWIEVDELGGDGAQVFADVIAMDHRFPTIVSANAALIDPVVALTAGRAVDILVDANEADRISALAFARAARSDGGRVADISNEPGAARLRQLSDEVSRIAQTLARLSTGGPTVSLDKPLTADERGDVPVVSGNTVRQMIRARRLRARFFDADLFADPAWDMLLDLFQAEIAQHRVPVSSLCIAAAVPPTTALRWIKTMTDDGLFVRRADPHDRRRIFVELAPAASDAMRRYFAEIGRVMAA
nr:hypothetical protein [uncultured Sphingomonas sp.]